MAQHRIYHTKEQCIELMSHCKNRSEFKKKHTSAFRCCVENGWENEVCPSFFAWDKPLTLEEAIEMCKKYESRSELWFDNVRLHYWLCKNDWLNKIPNLISKTDDSSPIHCVYVYIFPNKVAYVGRTLNKTKRHRAHKTKEKDPVFKYAKNHNLEVTQPIYLHDNLCLKESRDKEIEEIQHYKDMGYKLINTMPGGSIGKLSHKWTKNTCKELAKQFTTKFDFRNAYRNAYFAAMEHGWLKEYNWLKEKEKIIPNAVTYEMCYNEAKKYTTKTEFAKYNRWYSNKSYREGWMDTFTWLKDTMTYHGEIVEYDMNGDYKTTYKQLHQIFKKKSDVIYRKCKLTENHYAYGSIWFFIEDVTKDGEIIKHIDINSFPKKYHNILSSQSNNLDFSKAKEIT